MCRSIRTLHNLAPASTDEEIQAAALQYVRKIAGTAKPSAANRAAFDAAVAAVAEQTAILLDALVTSAPPRDRDELAARAKARSQARFATSADLT